MTARLLKVLLAGVLATAVIALAAWHWLLATDAGSEWLVDKARQTSLGPAVEFSSVRGNLRNGLELRDVRLWLGDARLEVDVLQLVLQPELLPLSITIPRLGASGVRLATSASAGSDAPGLPDFSSLQLPFPLAIHDAQLQQLAWQDSGQGRVLALDEVLFDLSWHRAVNVGRLQLREGELRAQAAGWLELNGQGSHRFELQVPAWPQPMLRGLSLLLEGDLRRSVVQLSAAYPALLVSGAIEDLAGTPLLDLEALLQAPLVGDADAALLAEGYTLQAFTVQLQGPLERVKLVADARVDTPLYPGVGVQGRAAFTPGDSLLQFSDLELALEGSSASLAADGVVDLGTGLLDTTLQWQNLAWPPAALQGEAAVLTSASGRMQLSGALSGWQLSARLALEAPGYPGGEIELDANGDQSAAELAQIRVQALGGRAQGSAAVAWAEGELLRISGQATLEQLDLAAINPGWPVDVSGQLGFTHDAAGGSTTLQLDDVDGRWMDQPVQAHGGVQLLPGDVLFEALTLNTAAAQLQLGGSLQSRSGVRFDASADGELWPGGVASGQLTASGQLLLRGDRPGLSLELAARQLVLGSNRIDAIDASGTLAEGIELAASGVTAFGLSLDQVTATAIQGPDSSALQWLLQQGEHQLSGALEGTALQFDEQFAPRWSGRLRALEWRNSGRALLTLMAPATAQIAPAGWSLADACLAGFDGGELCLARFAQADGDLALEGAVEDFPLGFFQELLQGDLQMTQELSGPFSFTQQAGALPSGNAQWRISPGRLRNPDLGNVLEASEGYMGFSLDRGQLRDGRIELQLPQVGSIDLDLAIDGVAFDGNGRLDGRLHAQVFDAAPFAVLFPALAGLQGQALVELDLGGRTADPELSGTVSISQGGVELPALGLQVWGLTLSGEVSERDALEMRGSARLGDGLAELQAQADFSDWWSPRLNLQVAGSDLLVANLPDVSALLDPQLALQWADGMATLSGSARLHHTLVQPLAGFVTPIEESDDVVIVGTLPGQNGTAARPRQPLALFGSVDLLLGEQVRFESDLATARLSGQLRLSWNGAVVPHAEGAIALNGQVSAFGPRLALEDSFLRFSGGVISNPVLDLSATRNVFGNTQVRAAGVRISGTATRPEVEAFTVPYTDQERAWALLITGSDLEYGQGIGGFDIGAYIAPRLYVSFGVSLFEEDTMVGVRYDLRRGFGIRATSGQRGSGIDATYTIDH